MGGIFQELMPEEMGGFEGFSGLDLIKDARLALAGDVSEQVCQSLVAELEPGEWDGRLVDVNRHRSGGVCCVVSNVIHCRGCLVCCSELRAL